MLGITAFSIVFFAPSLIFCEDSLEFVQVFFRHGQRTPTKYLTFPTDPPEIDDNLHIERGELTNTGMWQEYSLGSNLRDEYASLVDYKYRPSQLRVYTGVDNRTTVSALLALAAFLPPTDEQLWNPALPWQAIPTVSQGIIDHVSFGVFEHCTTLKQQLSNEALYHEVFNSFSNLTTFLEDKTGLSIPNLLVLQRVVDGVSTRDTIRDVLPLPGWADNRAFLDYLRRAQYRYHVKFMSIFLDQIGGWHYDQIVGGMDDFINKRSKHRIVMYSGHDTNLATIFNFMNFNTTWEVLPSFAAYMAFELHRVNDEHVVKIYFHNEINGTKQELFLSDCDDSPCTYAKFAGLGYARTSTAQWTTVCYDGLETNCSSYETLSGIFVVLTVVLLVCFASALWSCFSYKRKYIMLSDEERRSLI